ncbi:MULTISPECIES: thiamine pyrophosphate-binding protein [unclassified Oceanobacter]|uniref:thiamine pyrophosphate-binding protein n=1 Tax=unclassified Oceanobacter TaxID=2620260 RepID=UPI0027348A3A|nr:MULTISPECIES: thiamine pyrophosphate-binding protein [unclassified Oceanobacter]MDP2609367.1 thiamine pyrophosphate-binding protein [Oceanobacter sp. 1_MG-2023]MDP2612750.1 thiamine pyrophosphate-binding protein [Oceanobacter sp. 2_MG-2023]
MKEQVTVGEVVARILEAHRVSDIYGVISIHNLPIADAIGRREKMHFVCARGEAGAATMADAHSRFQGLGVCLTSTGAGAGNAIGSLIEACNAASPMLHITGQVESAYLDRDASFIHEAKDQLTFLRAASKAAYRITHPDQVVGILCEAIRVARTVPMGPVSVEIPIDVQATTIDLPDNLGPIAVPAMPVANQEELNGLLQQLQQARRPVIWVGGGAVASVAAVTALADKGIPVLSTTHARGLLPDAHPRSLRAFHNSPSVKQLLEDADLVLVVGSRLRSNETASYSTEFGRPLIQVDAHPGAHNRNYQVDQFICSDSAPVLEYLAEYLPERIDSDYDQAITQAVVQAESTLIEQVGNYANICQALRDALPADGIFVRDITVSGSTWGSRLLPFQQPNQNIHSLAGAIGLGLAHGIGAALANPDKKVATIVGDGGLMLGIGELATMVQENTDMVLIVMNDGGYGVMRGIQNNYFGGRQYYNELHTPNYAEVGKAMAMPSWQVGSSDAFHSAIAEAIALDGPALIEVDMTLVGPLEFAGPPQKKLY